MPEVDREKREQERGGKPFNVQDGDRFGYSPWKIEDLAPFFPVSAAKWERITHVVHITGFVWLEEIVNKLARRHQVEVHEAEEVFTESPKFRFTEKGHRSGENVYSASGPTTDGRYLIVFFVHKADSTALPLSARDMTKPERRIYERK